MNLCGGGGSEKKPTTKGFRARIKKKFGYTKEEDATDGHIVSKFSRDELYVHHLSNTQSTLSASSGYVR